MHRDRAESPCLLDAMAGMAQGAHGFGQPTAISSQGKAGWQPASAVATLHLVCWATPGLSGACAVVKPAGVGHETPRGGRKQERRALQARAQAQGTWG